MSGGTAAAAAFIWQPSTYSFEHAIQGDQIGRIFALWVTVYFGQFFKLPKQPKTLC
jgi:hypothetical protein